MNGLGNKEIMAQNIRYYMEENNIRPTDICTTLKIPMPTFSDWINAKTYPRIDKIELMANFFGISKSDLVEKRQAGTILKGIKIPVLGQVAAGIPIEAIEDIIDYEEIPVEWTKTGEYFGLKIKGDSMSPRILDGDVVIVRKQSTCDSSDIAVILVDGEDATVKKVQISNGGIMLIPLNPAYDPKFFDRQTVLNLPVTIIGKVVELRGKF